MSIRQRILIPMIILTIGGSISVLLSTLLLFNRNLITSTYERVDGSALKVEYKIESLMSSAYSAAVGIANNNNLMEAILRNDREKMAFTAYNLRTIAQLDFFTIVDKEGTVLQRTHEPDRYGDSLARLSNVISALDGKTEVFIVPGATVRLGVMSGAPMVDENNNIIGAVSLGYRLDTPQLVNELKAITGCEIAFYLYDECVSTTILNEDGTSAVGNKAADEIKEVVLKGKQFIGETIVFGGNAITKYTPFFGADNEVVGMMFVGEYTGENREKIRSFIFIGLLVTPLIIAICILISFFIARTIERRLAEVNNELRDAEERAQLMLNTSPLAVNFIDEKFNIIDSNKEALNMFGVPDKTKFQSNFFEYSPIYQQNGELSVELGQKYVKRVFDEGYVRFEWEHQRANGEIFSCDVTAFRSKYKNQNYAIVHMRDLSELKAAISQMRQADEYVQLLLDAMPLACSLWDSNINPIACNLEAVKLHKLSSKEEYIEKFFQLSPPMQPDGKLSGEKAIDCIKKTLEEGYLRIEWVHQTIDGELFPCEVTLIRLKHRGEYIVAGYIKDLSEHKAFLAEIENSQVMLRAALDTAESASRAKSVFLANMSHEIRTPMNSIIGFTELAQDDDITAKTRSYLNKILENAEWLLRIINDILDISKIESGKFGLEHIPFDLHKVFTSCQSSIMPKVEEKGIKLYCYAEPSIGRKLVGDPFRLRQVIANMLSNAVKFTNLGTIKLLASVLTYDDYTTTIHFEIKDSGIGMTQEQITKILEPFTQADSSITRKYGGTGLGLAITKNIIELMGGKLEVESTPGVGSKFSFDLAFDTIKEGDDAPAGGIVLDELEKPNFEGEVLVCEDNAMSQQVICEHLARVGLSSVIAVNGREGVDLVARRLKNNEKPFDLIFMDIHMPIMDGMEAAFKITSLGSMTPIIAMTANIMSNEVEAYKENGMPYCLNKPFTSRELWKCLLKYLKPVSYSAVDKSRQAADDEKLQKHLKINFVKENQATAAMIANAIEAGDLKLAQRLAHTLKTNSGQIGKNRLREAAADIEGILKEGKYLPSSSQIKELEAILKTVLDELAPLLAGDEGSNVSKTIDKDEVIKLLNQLEEMLANKNPKCMNLIDEIRVIPGSRELVKKIEDFEFKQGLEELLKLKEKLYGQ